MAELESWLLAQPLRMMGFAGLTLAVLGLWTTRGAWRQASTGLSLVFEGPPEPLVHALRLEG